MEMTMDYITKREIQKRIDIHRDAIFDLSRMLYEKKQASMATKKTNKIQRFFRYLWIDLNKSYPWSTK